MQTELSRLWKHDKEMCRKKIENMDSQLLFEELDDTIQFDICEKSNQDWTICMRSEKAVYNAIMSELRKRIYEKEVENNDKSGL